MHRFASSVIDVAKINKQYDDRLFHVARSLRKEQALCLTKSGYTPQQWAIAAVQNGFLQTVVERSPFSDTLSTVAFNHEITIAACQAVLNVEEFTPIEKVALYSYIVELGAREFIDPGNPAHVLLHLSAAKHTGFFFTPPSIAIRMVLSAIERTPLADSVLDPACGTGVFLAYYLLLGGHATHITGVELDSGTADLASKLLQWVEGAIDRKVSVDIKSGDFFDYFERHQNRARFDLIVMNPPYGNIKFLNSDLTDTSTKAALDENERQALGGRLRKATLESSAKLRAKLGPYGIGKGTLEYSKLFIVAVQALVAPNGYIAAITPSSWLGNESSAAFRRNLLESGRVHELWVFPEDAKLFKGVNQPTAVSIIGHSTSSTISISDPVRSVEEIEARRRVLPLQSVLSVSGEKCRLPKCGAYELILLEKLRRNGKIKENPELINARGELDITAYRQFISSSDTNHRLIRGDHIQGWTLCSPEASSKDGFVHYAAFRDSISQSAKAAHLSSRRIAIAQCSYLQKQKRIEAAIVPADCVVSNSCNYLALSTHGDDDEKLHYYWALINSSVLEWQFRIFSYNNHVSNQEIDELICVPYDNLPKQLKAHFAAMGNSDACTDADAARLDALIALSFSLSEDEYRFILGELAVQSCHPYLSAFQSFQAAMIAGPRDASVPNHITPVLSTMDKEIISYVQPGGNWTSIPESVPSKRLEQIREMARTRGMVRTTYYSRLKHNQPAYTISTYYHRPGNGANIHPWENRTLSSREAARLQSFPDSFVFEGTEAAVRKQIGNAVPPLLGFAIGNAIAEKLEAPVKFCDLFAGAGGLSCGLELAGFTGVAALEIDPAAASTFARNHNPDIHTLVGDIQNPQLQDQLLSVIDARITRGEPWVLVGGPPCQGFSTAGYRNANDARNQLVYHYLHIIARTRPAMVVMENVPGILSMSGGAVIGGIYTSLRDLGYTCHAAPWVVYAEQYGVPQMRKRVFIVASRDPALLPDYPEGKYDRCLGRRELAGQCCLDIHYPITVGEAFHGLPALMPVVQEYYPVHERINPLYNMWCRGEISAETLLAQR